MIKEHHYEKLLERTIATYERHAKKYAAEHSNISEIKKEADFFLKCLKGKKILDVGCGPGRDAKYFSDKGYEVTGIDISPGLLEIAAKNAPRAKFIKMDMRFMDFPKNSFDGIWAVASLLHIPKKDAKHTLGLFKKILKPGGTLFVSVKKGEGEKLVEDWFRDYSRFFAYYEEKELEELIKSCGFRIIKANIDFREDQWIRIYAIKE